MDKGRWGGPVRDQRRLFQRSYAEPGNGAGRHCDLSVQRRPGWSDGIVASHGRVKAHRGKMPFGLHHSQGWGSAGIQQYV